MGPFKVSKTPKRLNPTRKGLGFRRVFRTPGPDASKSRIATVDDINPALPVTRSLGFFGFWGLGV